ncbi:MAG: hypothetical protein PHW96_00250 [Candidatus Nanoarchaeia archaeon]|nr:hypothetical protein [Candidatus Nanoarchaeia archaeon]
MGIIDFLFGPDEDESRNKMRKINFNVLFQKPKYEKKKASKKIDKNKVKRNVEEAIKYNICESVPQTEHSRKAYK